MMTDRTLLDLYRHDLERPREDHYRHCFPGGSRTIGTLEFLRRTAALADSLTDLGVAAGDRVMVLCDNRPEWHMVDLAVLDLGAVDVPVYGTLTPQQVAYQLRDSGAVVAVADSPEQMAKILEARRACPELEHLVQVEGPREEGVFALDDLMVASEPGAEGRFWKRAARVAADDLATIVYTSGTTGDPKGVMLTHRNIVTNVAESLARLEVSSDDVGLEFLPLCHMIERLGGYAYMALGARRAYCSVYHVGELIASIRPTVFLGVPRVLEKVHAAVTGRAAAASPLKRALFNWALATGREVALRRLAGMPVGRTLAARHRLADRLVLAKVREALGGRVRFVGCGGAAVPLFVHEFFHAVGIPVLEAWGLTETSPVITLNGSAPGATRLGSVGRPLPSYQLRVADDGELLARGPCVFKGYWSKPEQTAEAFDAEGFFSTGDIGTVDEQGFVFITDRKKDLIVTSGGKNVAPQPIESQFKLSPLVDNAVLVGDGRPYIVVLIAPSLEGVAAWARSHGEDAGDLPRLLALPTLQQELAAVVERVNASLARFEQVRRFRLLPGPLTVDGGELTPTMKVKRRVVATAYAHLVDAMYAE